MTWPGCSGTSTHADPPPWRAHVALAPAPLHSGFSPMPDSAQRRGPDLGLGVELTTLLDDVPLLGHVGGAAVLVVRHGESVYALGASCTHWHAPMADGLVLADTILCPWHHACFDLATGAALASPALDPLPTYEVVHEAGWLRVGAQRPPPLPAPPVYASTRVVILGAGATGAMCAESLRREGFAGPIELVGDEAPVDRPNLSKAYLAGTADAAWLPLRSIDFYRTQDIRLTLDDPAVAVVPGESSVRLRGGRVLTYDVLVLATGAAPIRLDVDGADLPHVHLLRTLADADQILAASRVGRSVVVIGASFIGLEVAASLRGRGLTVSIVAPELLPFAARFGPEVGQRVKAIFERHGVAFHLGCRPERIRPGVVTLSDGSEVAGDLVVVGVGVKPRVELAEAAGLTLADGVVVDGFFRTSNPAIYAGGDVARRRQDGRSVRIEHWVAAMRDGQAIARTLVGRGTSTADVPFFWTEFFDVVLSCTGDLDGWDEHELHGSLADGDVLVAYRRAGRIVAVLTIGRDRASLQVEAALRCGDQAGVERLVRA